MNWDRVRAIAAKEWIEVKANRMIVLGMALLPIIMVGMILGTAVLLLGTPEAELGLEKFEAPARLAHLTAKEAFVVLMNDQYLLYLWIIPMMLPVSIAAYSIVGEKRERSLEPLLSSPVTTRELLLGKAVTATLPATLLGWVSYALTVLGLWLLVSGPVAMEAVRPMWSLGTIFVTPLLALLGTTTSMLVSARSTDVRAAQSIAGMLVLPLVGLATWILVAQVYLTLDFLVWMTVCTLALNIILVRLTERLFDREQILTRWM